MKEHERGGHTKGMKIKCMEKTKDRNATGRNAKTKERRSNEKEIMMIRKEGKPQGSKNKGEENQRYTHAHEEETQRRGHANERKNTGYEKQKEG